MARTKLLDLQLTKAVDWLPLMDLLFAVGIEVNLSLHVPARDAPTVQRVSLYLDEHKYNAVLKNSRGRPRKILQLPVEDYDTLNRMVSRDGVKKTAERLGISRATLYRRLSDLPD